MENYPTDNTALIRELNLQRHPEGGYFVETDRQEFTVPSPFAQNEPRSLATSIYYLLTADEPAGVILTNKSVTYHCLHQGRAEYTLIHPPPIGSPPGTIPTITTHVIGPNESAGETRMLFVGSGIWKISQLLPSDVAAAACAPSPAEARNKTGCLITEVVVPGFHWEDHKFLDQAGLEALFKDVPEPQRQHFIQRFAKHLWKDAAA